MRMRDLAVARPHACTFEWLSSRCIPQRVSWNARFSITGTECSPNHTLIQPLGFKEIGGETTWSLIKFAIVIPLVRSLDLVH